MSMSWSRQDRCAGRYVDLTGLAYQDPYSDGKQRMPSCSWTPLSGAAGIGTFPTPVVLSSPLLGWRGMERTKGSCKDVGMHCTTAV